MTTAAERLRALVKEATPGPWQSYGRRIVEMRHRSAIAHTSDFYSNDVDARLIALAPQLAELVADMGEALAWEAEFASKMSDRHTGFVHVERRARAALARLDTLFSEEDVT